MKKDRVVFRVSKGKNINLATELFAVLPDDPERVGLYTIYYHVGQHSVGLAHYLTYNTRLATEAEYTPLLRELTGLGYDLRVVSRIARRR